jgi:hypothetical protein
MFRTNIEVVLGLRVLLYGCFSSTNISSTHPYDINIFLLIEAGLLASHPGEPLVFPLLWINMNEMESVNTLSTRKYAMCWMV